MTQKFVIPGKLPGLNQYIGAANRHWKVGNRMKREHQAMVEWYILADHIRPAEPPVRLHVTFYEPNRRRDEDNVSAFGLKVIQDALVEMMIIPDDSPTYIADKVIKHDVDKKTPRIEVVIEEVGNGERSKVDKR